MAHSTVSSCVLSIVASFTSGLDVFKKLRDKRKRRKWSKGESGIDEEELQLSRSLRRGPEDIGREYGKSVHAVGEHFAIGDAIAQTSLAEILLKLNTGLVGIISSFLDRGNGDVQIDYRSLTDLSERSRMDTVGALRGWYRRMVQVRLLPAPQPGLPEPKAIAGRGEVEQLKRPTLSGKHIKVRGPTIARVVVQDSSKPAQLAVVKPGQKKKHSVSASQSHSNFYTGLTTPSRSPPPEYSSDYTPQKPQRPSHVRSKTAPDVPKPRRKHSAANIASPALPAKPDALRATRSTPRLSSTSAAPEPLPLIPHIAPLPALEPRRRKPTSTFYSIASDSTKYGEIPMHKWAVPYDWDAMSALNKEAEIGGWPVADAEGGDGRRKQRGGLFRLFRRKKEKHSSMIASGNC